MADTARGALSLTDRGEGTISIVDTRRTVTQGPRGTDLSGWKPAVCLASDRTQTLTNLLELDAVRESHVT